MMKAGINENLNEDVTSLLAMLKRGKVLQGGPVRVIHGTITPIHGLVKSYING